MKKLILLTVFCMMLNVSVSAEEYSEAIHMEINTNKIINHIDKNMYGFNNEWSDEVLGDIFLDKNYGRTEKFSMNFDDEKYYLPQAEYGTAYLSDTSSITTRYIQNGDKFKGNASYSSWMVKSGSYLYDEQYSDGALQKPKGNINAAADNKYQNILSDNLVSGGIEGYDGFSDRWRLGGDFSGKTVEDLTIQETGNGNHAMFFNPVESRGGSFFGKNRLALIDRKTVLEFKINIESALNGEFVLNIVRDADFEAIKDAEQLKYANTATLQFVKQKNTAWYDAVRFKNNKIYLGNTEICDYIENEWYTVRYTLDIKNNQKYENTLEIINSQNAEIGQASESISIDKSNGLSDIEIIKSVFSSEFSFNENSVYGYILSTVNDEDSGSTKIYVDDMKFDTAEKYDNPVGHISKEFYKDLSGYPFVFNRMAGVTANEVKWKNAIGDVSKRTRYALSSSEKPAVKRLGIAEWVNMANAMDNDAEFSYAININDSDEDITDLIEFMTANGDINGDGVDWAQKRRECGINAPVKVSVWEIGNEPDLNGWDKTEYLERCGQVIELLRKYDSKNTKIAVPISTQFGNKGDYTTTDWHTDALNMYGDKIDYLVYHTYYGDDSFYHYIDSRISRIADTIEESGKDVGILVTEHATGRYLHDDPNAGQDSWYKNIGLGGALAETEFFNRIFRYSQVKGACYHGFSVGPWKLIYEENGEIKPTAVYELLKLYRENGVGNVLESSIGEFDPNVIEQCGYSASAIKNENGEITVFFANHENKVRTVDLDINEDYMSYSKTVITGENPDSCNDTGKNEVSISTEAYTGEEITLQPYSVTMLKMRKSVVPIEVVYRDSRIINISGHCSVNGNNKNITILLKNKSTNEIGYLYQTMSDKEGNFNVNFKFNDDLDKYDILINAVGIQQNISADTVKISKLSDMLSVNTERDNNKINVCIDNKYNMENVKMTVLLCAYDGENSISGGRLRSANIIYSGNLQKGVSNLQYELSDTEGVGLYKVFMWDNMNNIKPLMLPKSFN